MILKIRRTVMKLYSLKSAEKHLKWEKSWLKVLFPERSSFRILKETVRPSGSIYLLPDGRSVSISRASMYKENFSPGKLRIGIASHKKTTPVTRLFLETLLAVLA